MSTTATSTAMPSRKLMFLLAISLIIGGLTVGRSYLGTTPDEEPEEFPETSEPFEGGGWERVAVDVWEPPLFPRDPFLQVEVDVTDPLDDAGLLDEPALEDEVS